MTTVDRVRDAMVPDPPTLAGNASAQEAGALLLRPEVRAVLVVDERQRLLGLLTRADLVARVVAAGRDPRTTSLGEVVTGGARTIEPDVGVAEAYRLMEAEDLERLPVTEDGRLVGVLSRSALLRRLAEDETPV